MSRRLRTVRLVWVALAGLTVGAAFGCRGTTQGGDDAAATASGASTSVGAGDGSRALVANPSHDFGRVTEGDTLRHTFGAHNASSEALAVEEAPEVLGCRARATPGTLEPGHGGTLEVTCRASMPGPLRVSLPLRANGRPVGELSLSAQVEPLLAFERSVIDLTMPFGEERTTEVRLHGKHAKLARLTPIGAPLPSVDVRVLPGDAGRGEGVAIHAKGKTVGTHVGSLRFGTRREQPREVSLPYVVKVVGTLTVSPTNPVLDLSAPGPRRALLRVTSTQPGFAVSRASVLEGPFTASVRRVNGGFEVEIGVADAKLPPGARGVNGRVQITSNDRTERIKEVPLLAIGNPATRAATDPSRP